MSLDDDRGFPALPSPAPNVVAFDNVEVLEVRKNRFLRGPMLISSVEGRGRIEILDGHPAEASSSTLFRLRADEVPAGGLLVANDTYIISTVPLRVHARHASPYRLRLKVPHAAMRQPRESAAQSAKRYQNVLARVGVTPVSSESRGDHDVWVVDVPFPCYRQAMHVLEQLDIAVEDVSGQMTIDRPRRRSR